MSTIETAPSRPEAGEYAPYYERYISLVQSTAETPDILAALNQQRRETMLYLWTDRG